MKDLQGRDINYMRISITDRCNLRCKYCMPDGIELLPMSEILTFEEILRVCEQAVGFGITRFKITGGEPLVRRGCADLIRKIKKLSGVEQVTMTTNGILLSRYLDELLDAGLDAVNISLDTMNRGRFEEITGFDQLPEVLRSIDVAVDSGLRVKVNVVLQQDKNAEEWQKILEIAERRSIDVRFIEMMPIGYGDQYEAFSAEDIKEMFFARYP